MDSACRFGRDCAVRRETWGGLADMLPCLRPLSPKGVMRRMADVLEPLSGWAKAREARPANGCRRGRPRPLCGRLRSASSLSPARGMIRPKHAAEATATAATRLTLERMQAELLHVICGRACLMCVRPAGAGPS